MKLSIDKIKSSSTEKLKSLIRNAVCDEETDDMIFKELFEIRNIKQF